MQLFQFVNLESLDPEKLEPEVRTRVTVAEGKHQRVNFGVGYGTEEKGRVDGEYHHVNFLGGARSAGVHARWSSLDRGIRLDFVQPYFFTPHMSVGIDGQRWYTFTPAYESIVTGGQIAFTHRTSVQDSWSILLTNEHTNSSIADDVLNDPTLRNDPIALGLDPTTGHQEGTLNAIGFDLQHSGDNLLNAHRGYQLRFIPNRPGGFCRARSTTSRCRWTGVITFRSATSSCSRTACSWAPSTIAAARPTTSRSRRSIFSGAQPACGAGGVSTSHRLAVKGGR